MIIPMNGYVAIPSVIGMNAATRPAIGWPNRLQEYVPNPAETSTNRIDSPLHREMQLVSEGLHSSMSPAHPICESIFLPNELVKNNEAVGGILHLPL